MLCLGLIAASLVGIVIALCLRMWWLVRALLVVAGVCGLIALLELLL